MCDLFPWGGFLSGILRKTENLSLGLIWWFAQVLTVIKWEKSSSQIWAADLKAWTLTSMPPCLRVTSQPQWWPCIQTVFNSPGFDYLVPLVHEHALTCPIVCPIFSQVCRSEIQNESPRDKIKVWQGCVPSEGSRGEPVSLPFPALGAYLCSLAHDHLPFESQAVTNSQSCFPCNIISLSFFQGRERWILGLTATSWLSFSLYPQTIWACHIISSLAKGYGEGQDLHKAPRALEP